MKRRRPIRGSGGDDSGGGSSRPPREDNDSLRSSAFIRVIDVWGEGEIEGLVDGEKSIYLNETPLQNDNGTLNFKGVSYETREGLQLQNYVKGAGGAESEISIGVELKETTGGDIVRQITNPAVDRLRVRFMIPQLTQQDQQTGDTHGAEVQVQVYVQPDGGVYTLAAQRTVSGKSSGRYQFQLDFALTDSAPWNVKIVRVTADSDNQRLQNRTYVEAIVEVIEAKLRYPNTAYVAMRIDAENFDSVPSRFYDLKLLKIQIPSNATVREDGSLTYDGSWDGTFQTAWSSNPAWVFYDLLTSERYGLGAFVTPDQVDKWALYEIGQYCDELIDDGFGGQEPRFSCNLLLQDRAEAYTVIQNLASVFRGMTYWAAGAITATQDSPQDAVYIYNTSNVVDGRFMYQGASAKARHTVVLVSWNDPEDFYRSKVEYVEDQAGIAAYGVQSTEVVAVGCTSRGQAHRLGKWILYTEQNESETVSFKVGLEGIIARPGQIIQISDPSRAGTRLGGRVLSWQSVENNTEIEIDQELDFSVSGWTLTWITGLATIHESTVVVQNGRFLQVNPDASDNDHAPFSPGVWVLQSPDVLAQTFRVLSIKEEEKGLTYTITAVKHDPDKFDAVEQDLVLEPKNYTLLREQTDSPENITVTETLYQQGLDVKVKVEVSWDRVDRAVSYLVRYKRDNDNYVDLPETVFVDVSLMDALPGVYTFEITAMNSFGKPSVPAQYSKEVFGKTLPPGTIQGFSMIPVAGQAQLTWTQSTDLDVVVGGKIRIRHTPRTTDQAWGDAIDIIPSVPGYATSAFAPLLSGTYMIKAIDSSGNISPEVAMIVTTVPYINALNVVNTQTEDPTFPGTKTNMVVDSGDGSLSLDSSLLVDDYDLIDDIESWDFPAGVVAAGSYDFQNTVDLGGVWPSRIISLVDLEAYDLGNFIDVREDPIDEWQDIDGENIDDVNAELFVRTTEDDPSGSPTWTDWKRIAAGEYNARGFQFQLVCTSGSELHNLKIKQLEVTIDVADRVEHLGPYTSGAGVYSVSYAYPFYADPSIAITAFNLGTGEYFEISNDDEEGFDIVFKNAGGTPVSRNFNLIAKGYGRRIA